MKKILTACCAIWLIGCKPNSPETAATSTSTTSTSAATTNGAGLTDAEQKALQLTATSLIGQATGARSPDGKTLEMTISNSLTMEQEYDLSPLHSSRAAWVFYKNRGTDQPKYENIVVKTQLKDTTINLAYSLAQLATVQARFPAIEAASQLLISGDYAGLHALFDPVVMGKVKVVGLQEYCTQIETDYGKPTSFEFRGFAFNKTSSGQDFLSLAGLLKRQIKDTPLNIAVDLSKPGLKGSLNSIKFDY